MDFDFKDKNAEQNNPQEGWNMQQDKPQADPQAGWNTPQEKAQADPQAGWGAQQDKPQTDPQAGWNTPQDKPQADPQAGWGAQQDKPQAGWNMQQEKPQTDPQAGGNAQQEAPQSALQSGWNSDVSQSEPRTPYQVPVREGSNASGDIPGMPNASNTFSTYEEWQRQNQKKTPNRAPKRKKRLIGVVGGVTAACLIFAGGILAGSLANSIGSSDSDTISQPPANTPTLTISPAAAQTGGVDDGLTGEQVYEKVSPSVVSIQASSLESQGQASGSGVIMTADGLVITNAHVVTETINLSASRTTTVTADKVTVVTNDGQQHTAKIVGYDEQTDLAVLQITDGGTFTPAEFGDSTQIKAGEKAYAIGSPGGVQLANSITTGSISAISRDITIDDNVMTLIQTDASINPGNSGGALINKYGQVIGITSAKLGISYYEGLGFAIPIDSAKEVVDQLIAYGHVIGRPAIGITGYNLSEQSAEYNGVPQGVVITEVDARSDAAAKGLQAKDIIIGVNGKEITTMDEINAEKEDLQAGDTITLRVYRIETGKTFDIEIVLADQAELSGNTAAPSEEDGNTYQIPRGNQGGYYFQLP